MLWILASILLLAWIVALAFKVTVGAIHLLVIAAITSRWIAPTVTLNAKATIQASKRMDARIQSMRPPFAAQSGAARHARHAPAGERV